MDEASTQESDGLPGCKVMATSALKASEFQDLTKPTSDKGFSKDTTVSSSLSLPHMQHIAIESHRPPSSNYELNLSPTVNVPHSTTDPQAPMRSLSAAHTVSIPRTTLPCLSTAHNASFRGSLITPTSEHPAGRWSFSQLCRHPLSQWKQWRAERNKQALEKLHRRPAKIELPLENGQFSTRDIVVWIDYNCPVNLFNRKLVEGLPLKYESSDQRYYADTPGGPAFSYERFKARWICEYPGTFDRTYEANTFEVLERDLGCDAIIGRPAIEKHRLIPARLPLAAPFGVHSRHLDIDERSVRAKESRAKEARQYEARQMGQADIYEQARKEYARRRAHDAGQRAYDEAYRIEYARAVAEY